MTPGPKLTRWLFVIACGLCFALALVVQSAGGPWYGVASLGALALASAYLALFAPDSLLMRVDRWIAFVAHWSP